MRASISLGDDDEREVEKGKDDFDDEDEPDGLDSSEEGGSEGFDEE